ncbi:hypothetical protein FQN49_001860 [Arthroderma sp. PD_2]|nr:hypothetical protein FQN49_001860 [Arthroderma sp. PD_2]
MASFDDNAARAKRRRIDDDTIPVTAPEITSYQQLRDILSFQQSISQETKQGVRHFKDFLSSIQGDIPETEKSKKLQVLQKYCASQYVKRGDDSPSVCFTDLVSTWNFAESNNEESLLSLIPSVLASFLKTVSPQLEFREFAIELSKYLLHKDNLKLFNRGLTASKTKDHLISPCLRLLTEIVSFDGGAVAKVVYAKRDITLKRLDVFLTARKIQTEELAEDRRKPTLRRIAQRYLLANLRYQSAAAKAEILGQGKLVKTFIEDIKRDAGDIVVDIIRTFDKYIVSDTILSRSVKSRFLSRWNLERLATLYGYERDSDEVPSGGVSVSDEVHKFLLTVCTNVEKGVLLTEYGWYPSGTNMDALINDNETISLGLDAPTHFDKSSESISVRNGNLSVLIQFLRPESDTRQMQLLLKIFRVAPELIYDYFSKRNMFCSDPKPTQAWLGESAFLFSTIQLPVPEKCGFKEGLPAMPPPVSVAIESILPRPLTQKMLTRCINQNTEIVTLFAIKATTAALRKLQTVLKMFESTGSSNPELWSQASGKLMNEFSTRCPTMKDTILAFRQTPKDDLQQQDALLELLSLFYQVTPTVAFEEKFDVSLTLVEILGRLNNDTLSKEDRQLLFSQLQHILTISQHSPAMRWWQKPESLALSAFTSVLKVFVEKREHGAQDKMNSLLQDVLTQNSILAQSQSFEALILSIQSTDEKTPAIPWSFIDNCLTRLAKRPVPYLDQVKSLQGKKQSIISPMLVVIREQWPFIVKAQDVENETATAAWISKFLGCLKAYDEYSKALVAVRDTMLDETKAKKSRSLLKKAFDHKIDITKPEDTDADTVMGGTAPHSTSSITQAANLSEVFGQVQTGDESHSGLHKWEREDLELAIDQGYIRSLILCVCSEHEEIRRQAVSGLSRFMAKLKESSFEERQPVYVLIGELSETVKGLGLETRAPFIVGELAVRMLAILTSPSHKLYGKVNKFLNKSPQWEVGKIPSYWIDKLLYHEPESDDSHHEEVAWLLDLFVSGLRSETDMDIYRRAGVFERLLSLYSSPALTAGLRKKILHLVYRVCEIGGSTTLLTRAAALSWVQGQIAVSDAHNSTLRALATELYKTSSHDWVDRWSGSALAQAVQATRGLQSPTWIPWHP